MPLLSTYTYTSTTGREFQRLSNTPRGAMITRGGTDLTNQNISATATVVPFTTTVWDTDSCTGVANRLSVPSGWSWVRVSGYFHSGLVGVSNWIGVSIRKNGVYLDTGLPEVAWDMGNGTTPSTALMSAPVAVTGGTDYFEMFAQTQDTSITIGGRTWMCLELIA